MREQMPIWDRKEVIVCIVLALCIGCADYRDLQNSLKSILGF